MLAEPDRVVRITWRPRADAPIEPRPGAVPGGNVATNSSLLTRSATRLSGGSAASNENAASISSRER